jgi:folate-binding protein YgfZ
MMGRKNSYYYQYKNPGYLKISGPDRLDFLQRQTTNDLSLLSAGKSLATVLTSPAGRILDVLWVIHEDDETYGVLTLPGQGEHTENFLKRRIFFMDKVTLENRSDELLQIDLIGDGTADLLHDLGVNSDPSDNPTTSIKLNESPVKVLMHPHLGPRLLISSVGVDQILSGFNDLQVQSLSAKEYQILRIEKGIPAAGHELVEDYTPLEINYRWAISDNKGCYTGQEVIARQINYDKVTRHLIGLSLEKIPQENLTLYSRENDQPAGKVTSSEKSPRFGPIALAVVKRPFHEPGTELFLRLDDAELPALVNKLPFQ